MKIPQYQSQVNAPSAPQFNNIADVRNDSLAVVADGLDKIYQIKLKEQEEAKKTAFFQADTSIKMGIAKAKFDLMESIKNGGSYADAEAKYQKAHDTTIAQYASAFDADESGNTKLRAMSEYQADGLNNLLSIRDAVTSRRRSDTASAASNRLDMLRDEYALADTPEKLEEVKSKMSSTLAGLSATGIITGDEGKQRLRNAIQGAESQRLELFRQNNTPDAFLQEVEKSKSLLDVNDYITKRGTALNDIAKVDSVNSVKSYLQNPAAFPEPKQQSVDMFYEEELRPLRDQSLTEYEAAVISNSAALNKVPSQVRNQVASYYAMEPASMNESDLQTVASLSRMVSGISDRASRITESELPKEDIAKARLITRRMDAGIDVRTAMTSMKNAMDSPESKKIYTQAASESRSILMQKKIAGDLYETDDKIPSYASMDFIDFYADQRVLGASIEEAKDIAEKELFKRYKDFNGVKAKDPATSFSIFNEESWVSQANAAYQQYIGVSPDDKTRLVVYADSKTKAQIASGKPPEFLVSVHPENGFPYNLLDPKSGKPVRLRENKEYMTVEKQRVFSKGSGLKTINSKEYPFNGNAN
jgi:hypothetical protein